MKKVEDLFKKLNKIEWNEATDETTLKGKCNYIDAKLTIRTHMTNLNGVLPAVQVLFDLKLNDATVVTWGSTSEEDNESMLKFFQEIRNDLDREERKRKLNNESFMKELFAKL